MSIFSLDINAFKQDFSILKNNKEMYGEVHTDFKLINDMFDMIPQNYFENPDLTWLDPCAGKGYFCIILYKKLFDGLSQVIADPKIRHTHIITKMIYMVELNIEFIPILKKMFGEISNIYHQNFLDFDKKHFNFIIGNPPFNFKGSIKVPTSKVCKKKDGKTIWQNFIKKAMSLLSHEGFLLFITPSIWMKNDHEIFNYLLKYRIIKIKTMNKAETNKIFHKQAQTPTCYFLIQNNTSKPYFKIYDKTYNTFNKYNIYYQNNNPLSLPLFAQSIIQKVLPYTLKYGSLKVIKTNMRPGYKGLTLSPSLTGKHPYPNIKTCKLNYLQPQIVVNFSNIPCSYFDKPKLVLAHKMHGFPYLDFGGLFGISNRDNYVILNKTYQEFSLLHNYLSTNFIRTLFESTRYRMSYLEKYIFEILPDITLIPNLPEIIDDESLCNFFGLDDMERKLINTFHKKYFLL